MYGDRYRCTVEEHGYQVHAGTGIHLGNGLAETLEELYGRRIGEERLARVMAMAIARIANWGAPQFAADILIHQLFQRLLRLAGRPAQAQSYTRCHVDSPGIILEESDQLELDLGDIFVPDEESAYSSQLHQPFCMRSLSAFAGHEPGLRLVPLRNLIIESAPPAPFFNLATTTQHPINRSKSHIYLDRLPERRLFLEEFYVQLRRPADIICCQYSGRPDKGV